MWFPFIWKYSEIKPLGRRKVFYWSFNGKKCESILKCEQQVWFWHLWPFLCWHSIGGCLSFVGFFPPFMGGISLLMAFTFRTYMEFPTACVFFLSFSLFFSLISSVFSPCCPCSLIVPSGLVAVARAVFIHPEWEAEGHQGSNSPSALGIEEMHGSMAGIPEPQQSKETPEWWVKMVS